jgi:hypothetical protein
MGMIFEDLEDHEGYAARRLPDGTLASAWTQDTAAFDAYVGACTDTTSIQPPKPAAPPPKTNGNTHMPARCSPPRSPPALPSSSTISAKRPPSSPTTAPSPPGPSPSGSPPGPSTSCKRTATTELHHRLDALGHQQPDRGLSL